MGGHGEPPRRIGEGGQHIDAPSNNLAPVEPFLSGKSCASAKRCSRIVLLGISRGMSTKHVRSTGDLIRFGCALRVECTHCSSTRTLSAKAAVKGLGLVEIRGAAKRFRCIRCGVKAAKLVVLPPV